MGGRCCTRGRRASARKRRGAGAAAVNPAVAVAVARYGLDDVPQRLDLPAGHALRLSSIATSSVWLRTAKHAGTTCGTADLPAVARWPFRARAGNGRLIRQHAPRSAVTFVPAHGTLCPLKIFPVLAKVAKPFTAMGILSAPVVFRKTFPVALPVTFTLPLAPLTRIAV